VEQCERQEEEPPTERQVAYALSLGIAVSGISSLREMSSAISTRTGGDKPAHPAHVDLAEDLGIDTWAGIGSASCSICCTSGFAVPGRKNACARGSHSAFTGISVGTVLKSASTGFPRPSSTASAPSSPPSRACWLPSNGRDAMRAPLFGSAAGRHPTERCTRATAKGQRPSGARSSCCLLRSGRAAEVRFSTWRPPREPFPEVMS
jgi:hypothetical protein